MGIIGDAFRGAKNASAGFAAKQFAKNYLARYGEVLDLEIDAANKRLMFHFLPKGERENVLVRVKGYSLSDQNGRTFITIEGFEASREWIGLLAQDFLVRKPIEIPAQYASAVKMVL